MTTYSGNQYGDRRLYVFDRTSGTGGTQANFIKTIPVSLPTMAGATSAYVFAGGDTYGSTGELLPFLSNKLYENFARTEQSTLTSLDNTGGTTSTVVNFTPDPRSHIGIFITGDATGFTGRHMDEIEIQANDGNTYGAFLGRLVFGEESPILGTTSGILELLSYGLSGSTDPSTLYAISAGKTLLNKTSGSPGVVAQTEVIKFIDIDAYKEGIKGQAAAASEGSGALVGLTIGDGVGRVVFFQKNNKETVDFVSTLLPAFAHGGSGISGCDNRQENIFTIHAGTTGTVNDVPTDGKDAIWGITFNAVTGGTIANTSEFEEFAHNVIHLHTKTLSDKQGTARDIRNAHSIRDVDDIAF